MFFKRTERDVIVCGMFSLGLLSMIVNHLSDVIDAQLLTLALEEHEQFQS